MSNKILHLTQERTITVEEGWGVFVDLLYETDNDRISGINVLVVEITLEHLRQVERIWCVWIDEDNFSVPAENFAHVDDLKSDDTHDLRTRWFATEAEAREHAENVLSRWKHPAPWESFVQL